METHDIIVLSILLVIGIDGLIGLFICKRNIAHCDRMLVRIDEVYDFRTHILFSYPMHIYDALPSMEEMIEDGKELKLSNYINTSDIYGHHLN